MSGIERTGEGADGTSGSPPDRQADLDFQAMLDSICDLYLVVGPDLEIIYASDAYLREAGAAATQIIGSTIAEAFGSAAGDVGPTSAAGLQASLEWARRTKAADRMPIRSSPGPVPPALGGGIEVRYWSPVSVPVLRGGELAYIVHRLEDVTEYVRINRAQVAELEQRMRPAETTSAARSWLPEDADAVTNDFLERMAHELRHPLTTVIGFGELLSLDEATAEHREWIAMMLKAARRLVQILDDSRDVARIASSTLSLSMEAVQVGKLVDDVVSIVRPLSIARGVQLDPSPAAAARHYVYADDQRLRQVLINLLANAIKYNHPAGTVTVTAEPQQDDHLRISVIDTGRGIDEDDLGKLFRPFERLDAAQAGIEGTGLGLALSRDLVSAMGGAMGVTSALGTGTAFWIDLPTAEPTAVSHPVIQRSTVVATREYSRPRTLLYVEDMVENLRLVEHILRHRPSVRVMPAMLAGVAIDLARQHHPDMILLDLHLPDMPGEEVLSVLQADPTCAGIPIAILSADTSPGRVEKLLAMEAVKAYLPKPIGVEALLKTVDRLLGELGEPEQRRPPELGANVGQRLQQEQ